MATNSSQNPKKKDTEKRNYIIAAGVLIVILSLISILDRSHPNTSQPQIATNQPAQADAVSTDPKASSQIMQQVVDQQQIQKEVQSELDVNQKIIMLDVPDSTLTVIGNSGNAVSDYIASVNSLVSSYNKTSIDITKQLFDAGTKVSDIDSALENTQALLSELYKMNVPKDAVGFHKAVIEDYSAYTKLISTAKSYNLKLTNNPWKDVYNDYAVVTAASDKMQQELSILKKNYNLQ